MKLKIYTLTITFVFFLCNQFSVCAQEKDYDPKIRVIAAGIADSLEKIRSAQAVISISEFTPKAFFEAMPSAMQKELKVMLSDQRKTSKVWWSYRVPEIAMSVRYDSMLAPEPGFTRLIVNKQEEKYWDRYSEIGGDEFERGSIFPVGTNIQFGLIAGHQAEDPRYYAFYLGNIPLNLLLLKNTGNRFFDSMPTPLYKGLQTIEDGRCMQVEINPAKDTRWILWIDIEHGFIIRQQKNYVIRGQRTVLESETYVTDVIKSGDVWLPASVEIRRYPFFAKDAGKEGVLAFASITKIIISDFKMGVDFAPDVFEMHWPVGTNVSDMRERKVFVVTHDYGQDK